MPATKTSLTQPYAPLARPAEASLWRRFGAFGIDLLLILLAALPIYLIPLLPFFQGVAWAISHSETPLSPLTPAWYHPYLASSLAVSLVLALYFALCFARGGRTLGMRFAGIRVISHNQQLVPTALYAFLRSLIFWLPFLIAALDFRPEAGILLLALAALWSVVDRKHRLLPDIMARSQVIRELNQSPYLTYVVIAAIVALLAEIVIFSLLILTHQNPCYASHLCPIV